MPDYKGKSRRTFDRQASVYDRGLGSRLSRECYPAAVNEAASHRFSRILDLGCGTGVLLQRITGRFPECTAEGLDISGEMLRVARERLGSSVGLTEGDAENMPYLNGEFDLVVCTESFHHYPNPEQALREIYRVLRSGGCFILCDAWLSSPLRQIVNAILPFLKSGDVHVYSEKEITNLIKDAGFARVTWRKISDNTYLCVGYKEGMVEESKSEKEFEE